MPSVFFLGLDALCCTILPRDGTVAELSFNPLADPLSESRSLLEDSSLVVADGLLLLLLAASPPF